MSPSAWWSTCARALSVLTVVAGCGSPSDDAISSDSSIRGGKPVAGHPEIVLLDLPGGEAHCTGALVSPRVVLTAAHCLNEPKVRARLASGAGLVVAEQRPYEPVGDESFEPGKWDVGVLILGKDAPVTTFPRLGDAKPPPSAKVYAVGRISPARVDEARRSADLQLIDDPSMPEYLLTRDVLEGGDSGGPVYLAGTTEPTIVAVSSATLGIGEPDPVSAFARVDANRQWLKDILAETAATGSSIEDVVLSLVNTMTDEDLTTKVGLPQVVAASIVFARAGRDGQQDTADDVPFTSINALRQVPLFAKSSEDRLRAYAAQLLSSRADPWRAGLPKGKVGLTRFGLTIFENRGTGAVRPDVIGRVSCDLRGDNPGSVTITCKGPGVMRRRLIDSGWVSETELAGRDDFPPLSREIGRSGAFEMRAQNARQGGTDEFRIAGKIESDGRGPRITIGVAHMKTHCHDKFCLGGVYTDIDLLDPVVLDRARLEPGEQTKQYITELEYAACVQEHACGSWPDGNGTGDEFDGEFVPTNPMAPLPLGVVMADRACTWLHGRTRPLNDEGAWEGSNPLMGEAKTRCRAL